MKTRQIILGLLGVATLVAASTLIAYHVGYRHGGDAERACWALDPAPPAAWIHGVITARRDTIKHPFLKPTRIELRGAQIVNSIPETVSY
jgi:hypothetical protein